MVRGYHIYNTPVVNEELRCRREPFNAADVTMVKEDTTVGHVPRKISTGVSFSDNCLVVSGRESSVFANSCKESSDSCSIDQLHCTVNTVYVRRRSQCHDVIISPLIQNFAVLIYFRGSQPIHEECEILHHAKISRYTVVSQAVRIAIENTTLNSMTMLSCMHTPYNHSIPLHSIVPFHNSILLNKDT